MFLCHFSYFYLTWRPLPPTPQTPQQHPTISHTHSAISEVLIRTNPLTDLLNIQPIHSFITFYICVIIIIIIQIQTQIHRTIMSVGS